MESSLQGFILIASTIALIIAFNAIQLPSSCIKCSLTTILALFPMILGDGNDPTFRFFFKKD